MTAYNYNQPSDATVEQNGFHGPSAQFDISPNFNGQNGVPYNGNFVVTATNEVPEGILWTAVYAVAGPNTITLQFTAPLQTASTTTADYTLSGTGAPSISSVVWVAGSREILLNLSGALVATNTYTLVIGLNKVLSGSQIDYSEPKWGTYNWPGLIVDVIQPLTIDVTGAGLEQNIGVGSPAADNTGLCTSIGIDQGIDIGSPAAATSVATTGIGIEQDVGIGSPAVGLFAMITGIGIDQGIDVGDSITTQEQMPLGVGIDQEIVLGMPASETSLFTPNGVGIQQNVGIGSPISSGSGNAIGIGIAQSLSIGLPTAVRVLDQSIIGIGIDQVIDVGEPNVTQTTAINVGGVGIEQDILSGSPNITQTTTISLGGVGIQQDIGFGLPVLNHVSVWSSVGIQQTIQINTPNVHQVGSTLQLTQRQANTFVDLDTALQKAFADGVSSPSHSNLIEPIGVANHAYRDIFTPLQQSQTKIMFKDLAAATMAVLNIPGVLPATNDADTTSIAKETTSGSSGALVFVDGILVSKLDPT